MCLHFGTTDVAGGVVREEERSMDEGHGEPHQPNVERRTYRVTTSCLTAAKTTDVKLLLRS